MTNGNDSARAKHLESLASGAKRYVLNEVLEVSEAVAAELANIGDVEFIEGSCSNRLLCRLDRRHQLQTIIRRRDFRY